MFDALLMPHDGTTITANITPVLTTRVSGSAVIDLGETPAKGLSAVMMVGADLAETSDTLQVTIQECATLTGTFVEVGHFPLLTKGTGMPGTYVCRFHVEERYVRALIVVSDSDAGGDFTVASVYILLTPYAFKVV